MKRLLAGALIVLMMSPLFDTSVKAHESPASSSSLINPLRKYLQFKALRPFTPELKAFTNQLIEAGDASEVAVYFRSFNDGVWIGVNERKRFAPASLMKVPIMIAYLKEAEKRPELLKTQLSVETAEDVNQFIQSKVFFKPGEIRSVDELIDIMVRDSNNDAMRTLIKNANTEEILKMYDQLGYSAFINEGDFLSLKAYVGTFRVLYNATFLNEEMSEKALKLLARADFEQGIVAGVPKDVMVAHKFGEYGDSEKGIKQLHDVGIIYHEDNPYLLGIMTRGQDYAKLAQVIEKISSFIYSEVDRQYRASEGEGAFQFKFEEEA